MRILERDVAMGASSERRRIRVVHLITSLNLGGAERMVSRLVQTMDRRRFTSTVVSLLPGGAVRASIEKAGVDVHSLGIDDVRSTASGAVHLAWLLGKLRPDVLQTWLYHADLLGLTVGAMTRVPHLFWNIRCTESLRVRNGTRPLQRLLSRLSPLPEGIVVNSLRGKEAHERIGYRPRRWHFIPNGFDLSYFSPRPELRAQMRQELKLDHDARVIVMVARYHPMKDHALFFRAAAELGRLVPNVAFVLAGPGMIDSNPAVTRLIDPSLASRVRLLGPRPDVPELYAATDVATLTSAYGEGFPNVVGEAMACGVPCVVTSSGDAGLIVGSAGWVVGPGDTNGLVLAWRAALAMTPEERKRRSEEGRRRIAENFEIGKIVAEYESLYEQSVMRSLGSLQSTPGPHIA